MQSRFRRRYPLALFTLAGLALTTTVASAQALYNTGFEAPTYHTGDLAGQDGWLQAAGDSSYLTVQSTTVFSGTQALQILGNNAGQTGVIRPILFDTATSSNKVIDVSAEIYVTNAAQNDAYAFSASDGGGNFIGRFNVLSNGGLQIVTPDFPDTSPVIPFNAWTLVDTRYDFTSKTFDVFVNGSAVASNEPFATNSGSTVFGDLITDTFGIGGTNSFFVDNINVAAVPELSTILVSGIFVGLGGISLLRMRRQR